MSQLNPNAAEFVPVSPTRSIPSPACRLLNDQVISQSPRRATANDIDINLPNPVDFEKEVKSRPSDVDSYSNGHGDESPLRTTTDLMETLLNGKNIDEIPEFQPTGTPNKLLPSEEFHFGPNAAPFTPSKLLDQSEAAVSTTAVFGDESSATLGTSFNESVTSQDTAADLNVLNKESDPMSMSFYADREDSNPFDLNQVHVLPDNIDEFLKKTDSSFNETISDLPEHNPLGDTTENLTLNNDDAIQTTDLDKGNYYEEKELASPLEPEKEAEECSLPKTPEPTHENLLDSDFCRLPEKPKSPEILPADVELISPELRAESTSPRPESYSEDISKSPLPEATEVADLLAQPEPLPRDVELISEDLGVSTHEESSDSPELIETQASEVDDMLQSKSPLPDSKSPAPEALEAEDLLKADSDVSSKSPLPDVCGLPQSKTPTSDILEAKSPVPGFDSPVCELPVSRSPVCELPIAKSPVCELQSAKSPTSESPVCEVDFAKSPVCERPSSISPVCELGGTKSPAFEPENVTSPVCQLGGTESPVCELGGTKSPVCEVGGTESPVCDIGGTKSPLNLEIEPRQYEFSDQKSPAATPDFTKEEEIIKAAQHFEEICKSDENLLPTQVDYTSPEVIEIAQEKFDEIFKPKEAESGVESPQEEVTSSVKDEVASPTECPLLDQVIEDSFVADQSSISEGPQETAGTTQDPVVESSTHIPDVCTIPTSNLIEETESVVTTEMNSFLERSLPPDVASPLSPVEQDKPRDELPVLEQSLPSELDLDHPLMKCVYPLPTEVGEHIDIKTENISPQFAEQAIVTPSEESKQEDVPTAPPVEEPVRELVVEEKKAEEQSEVIATAAGIAAATAAVAGAAAAVAAVKPEKEEKKKAGVSPAKKPAAAKTSSRTPTSKAATTPKPATSRLTASPKTSPVKSSTAKPAPAAAAPKPATAKSTPRPKPATSAPKPLEKKPLANGDIKSTVKSTLLSKRAVSETTATKSATPRPASSGTARLSPTKLAASKAPAPRPATAPAPKTTTTRTSASTLSAAPKPRPTTLTSRTTTTTASSTAKSATATKSPPTKISPRTTTAPRPKPTTTTSTTSALSKPRVPLSKTITKAADTEKQNKESANKLTASRSVTSTTRTASATARATSTTTTRRVVESKMAGTTRTSKTTTTTMKSTTAKKPAELVRHPATKAKTTKVEKPKENGITTVVTEEIRVVTSTTNGVIGEGEPQLLKDNSPVDNKLIESALIETNAAD